MKASAVHKSNVTFQKNNTGNQVYPQNGFNIKQYNSRSYTPNNRFPFAQTNNKPLTEKRMIVVIPDSHSTIKHAASIPASSAAKITVGEAAKQSGHGAFLLMHNLRVAFDEKVLQKLPNWLKKTIIIGGTTGGTLAFAGGCSRPSGTPGHPTPTPIVITTPTPIPATPTPIVTPINTPIPTPVPGVGQNITNTLEPLGIIQPSSSSVSSKSNGIPDDFNYEWYDCDEYGNMKPTGYTQNGDLVRETSTPETYNTKGKYIDNATHEATDIAEAYSKIEGGYKVATTKSTGTRFNAYKRFGDEVRIYKMENGTIGDLLTRMVKGKVAGVVEFIGKDGSSFRKYTKFILR